MRRAVGLLGLALLVGLARPLVRSSDGRPGAPVSEAEARAHLDQLVAAGQAHDFDKLCSLAGAVSSCRVLLDDAGRDAVPSTSPRVVSATYRDAQTDDGTPGWVLVVTGTDGRGRPYRTEVLVFHDDESKVKATNAVYWSGTRVAFDDPDGDVSPG